MNNENDNQFSPKKHVSNHEAKIIFIKQTSSLKRIEKEFLEVSLHISRLEFYLTRPLYYFIFDKIPSHLIYFTFLIHFLQAYFTFSIRLESETTKAYNKMYPLTFAIYSKGLQTFYHLGSDIHIRITKLILHKKTRSILAISSSF